MFPPSPSGIASAIPPGAYVLHSHAVRAMSHLHGTDPSLLGPERLDELRAALRPVVADFQERALAMVNERGRDLARLLRRQTAAITEEVRHVLDASKLRLLWTARPDGPVVWRAQPGPLYR